jgi:hypothetical protein
VPRLELEQIRLDRLYYTVVCGYEFDIGELVQRADDPVVHTFTGSIIATDIEFGSAAHLMRTLEEHGEGDMTYWMLPSRLYHALVD